MNVNENGIYYIQHQFDLLFNTISTRLKLVKEEDARPRILASKWAMAFTDKKIK